MRQKIFFILTGFLFFLTALYGCTGLLKEPVGKNYFNLALNPPVSGRNDINQGQLLLVKEFSINPAFDSHSFIYRVGINEYENDYYNEFVNYPAKLITEKISEALYLSSHFTSGRMGMSQNISYRLSGKINRFYIDFQDSDRTRAVIEIRMILEKKQGHTFNTVSNQTYVAEEPVLSRKPPQMVSAWNTGLRNIMIQFLNSL